ncbi:MAG: cytochrome-c peroxidase, partial [Rhizorhabdus sp.]|nr:cytochrome-c peroxidase [Rhizorhabdus sp.]
LFLFEGPAGCTSCHAGPHFSDAAYHAILPVAAGDRGLSEATGKPSDDGRFRTPGLRNVALTAPYFHDGSAPTLMDAIRRHNLAYRLSDRDMADLTALLASLTDRRFIENRRLSLPDKACGRRL